MSLYIGHLSPRVRREELERVFRRFGRCTVQLKDGYGFIVYEVTADAEKALRALHGRNICGEQISLNWSNRQPRPFHRSARASRFYEPYRGRSFKDEGNGVEIRGFHDRRDFTGTSHVRTNNHGGHHVDDVLDKEAGHISVNVDDIRTGKCVNLKDGVTDEGGASELNPLENDRWGEPASDALIGHELGNSSEFDRYEPYHGYHRREEKENNQMGSPYGSLGDRISPEKGRRDHSFDESERKIDRPRPQQSCYNCGLAGHIMRNCPRGDSRQDKFSRFNHSRNEINFRDRGEGRVKKARSNSWGRPNSSKGPLVSKRQIRDRKERHYKKARRARRNSSESSLDSRENIRGKPREDLQAKKKRKMENGTPKKVLKKRKLRRSGTSLRSSSSSATSSQSHSKSLVSSSDASSHSRSRSPSSRSRSKFSGSKSASKSSFSKSLSSRSKLKSGSKSESSFLRSPSLSVSLEQRQPPFPEKVNIPTNASSEDNLDYLPSPESNHKLEISEPVAAPLLLKDQNEFGRFKVAGETDGNHPGSDGAGYSTHKDEVKRHNSRTDVSNDIDVTSEYQRENSDLNGTMTVKPKMQVPVRCGGSYSSGMSTQDILAALRHYGLPAPEENESNIPVERYFGAARLWPWEIIYYRRLKKGPISQENYARRQEQNREFGIVDRYIRSSSGWGECDQIDS